MLRGEVYPLSVAAERTQQAHLGHRGRARDRRRRRWPTAPPAPATTRCASTSRSACSRPSSQIVTPIRDGATAAREQAIAYLEARGLPVPAKAGAYSINRGLWGTTWGGGWTHDTWAGPPAELLEPPAGRARRRARS